jgi:hypothetical protein
MICKRFGAKTAYAFLGLGLIRWIEEKIFQKNLSKIFVSSSKMLTFVPLKAKLDQHKH